MTRLRDHRREAYGLAEPDDVGTLAPIAAGATAPRRRESPWSLVEARAPGNGRSWALLALIAGLLTVLLVAYNVPARPGTDQSAYMMTARRIAQHGELGFERRDPLQFAGTQCVVAPNGRVYAKYPFGYPLLAAIGRWTMGPDGMYFVNPICTVLAVVMSFFLFRLLVSEFTALVGSLLLACNPVVLAYANDSNSHASALLCVVVGSWGLLSWWFRGGAWRGLLGGFAFGYACTIRYSEALLLLPVLYVAFARVVHSRSRLAAALPPLIGWAIPVGTLALVCWTVFGAPWRTGYSLSDEDFAFGLRYLLGDPGTPAGQGNWESLLYQLNHIGLFLLLPFAILGVVGMFWRSRRVATFVALTILPSSLLYLNYYWSVVGEQMVGYLRLFMTVLPGVMLAILWLLDSIPVGGRAARALTLGVLVSICATTNVLNILPHLSEGSRASLVLRSMELAVDAALPPGSLILAEPAACNQLNARGKYELYNLDLFEAWQFNFYLGLVTRDPRYRHLRSLQRVRAQEYVELLGKRGADGRWVARTRAERIEIMSDIVRRGLDEGRRVALLVSNKRDWADAMGRGLAGVPLGSVAWAESSSPDPRTGVKSRWTAGIAAADGEQSDPGAQDVWTLVEVVAR